jgi:hypothetical protein
MSLFSFVENRDTLCEHRVECRGGGGEKQEKEEKVRWRRVANLIHVYAFGSDSTFDQPIKINHEHVRFTGCGQWVPATRYWSTRSTLEYCTKK